MMGSPFYYDVLYDEGPGDVVFHDCMWSGICTCCIQLLHQDSFYYTNESPDLKLELSYHQHTQLTDCSNHNTTNTNQTGNTDNLSSSTCLTKDSNRHTLHHHHHHHHHQANHQYGHQTIHQQDLKLAGQQLHPASHCNSLQNHLDSALILASSTSASPVTATSSSAASSSPSSPAALKQHNHHHHHHASCTSINNNNISNSINNNSNALCRQIDGIHNISSQVSQNGIIHPDNHHNYHNLKHLHSASNNSSSAPSTSTSPDNALPLSNSASPKPVRRREHNDSERKRRDHLRNAFNFLRDQVPRFKAINKKPPRIQILHEATLYVQRIIKESQELERRHVEEKSKHERLQNHLQKL